jgi:hypothetical protein
VWRPQPRPRSVVLALKSGSANDSGPNTLACARSRRRRGLDQAQSGRRSFPLRCRGRYRILDGITEDESGGNVVHLLRRRLAPRSSDQRPARGSTSSRPSATQTSTPSNRQACASWLRHPASMMSPCPMMSRSAGRSSIARSERAAAGLSAIFFRASGGTRTRS